MDNCCFTGAGIYVFNSAVVGSTQVPGSIPNNGLAVSLGPEIQSEYHLRVSCYSDSPSRDIGELIGLDGSSVITNSSLFSISHPNPGELHIENRVESHVALTHGEQGVYSCHIPLQNGEIRELNIGIYHHHFSGKLTGQA